MSKSQNICKNLGCTNNIFFKKIGLCKECFEERFLTLERMVQGKTLHGLQEQNTTRYTGEGTQFNISKNTDRSKSPEHNTGIILTTNEKKTEKEITPELLEKDMFESTNEYINRICSLGRVKIGQVTLVNYDADEEIFSLELKIDEELQKHLNDDPTVDNPHISIDKAAAKSLYTNGTTYSLFGEIDDVEYDEEVSIIEINTYYIDKYKINWM